MWHCIVLSPNSREFWGPQCGVRNGNPNRRARAFSVHYQDIVKALTQDRVSTEWVVYQLFGRMRPQNHAEQADNLQNMGGVKPSFWGPNSACVGDKDKRMKRGAIKRKIGLCGCLGILSCKIGVIWHT